MYYLTLNKAFINYSTRRSINDNYCIIDQPMTAL